MITYALTDNLKTEHLWKLIASDGIKSDKNDTRAVSDLCMINFIANFTQTVTCMPNNNKNNNNLSQ